MNFSQLQYFLAVARFRSFTEASEMMFISQSAISKQIKKLEDELDTTLFQRDSRVVELTEAGKKFLPFAEKMTSMYLRSKADMEEFSLHRRKSLSVCMEPGSWAYGFPQLIQAFAADHPEISIDIRERPSESIIERLDNGTSDMVLTWIDDLPEELYTVIPLIADPAVVITHPKSELAKKDTILPHELTGENIAMLARDINRVYYQYLEERGLQNNLSFDFSRTESLFNVASSGAGIAMVLGERAHQWKNTDIAIVRMKDDPIIYHYSAVFKKRAFNPAVEELVSYLRSELAKKIFTYASVCSEN